MYLPNPLWGCPDGVMVKALDCGIVVSKFELQSCYCVHFWSNTLRKGMNSKQGRTHKWCTLVDPHTWLGKSRTASTNIHSANYVRIRDVVRKTCLRRWTIGKSGERGSGISVLPARHDDDDGLNNITVVLLEGWLWHYITHKGWYAIKTKKSNQPSLT